MIILLLSPGYSDSCIMVWGRLWCWLSLLAEDSAIYAITVPGHQPDILMPTTIVQDIYASHSYRRPSHVPIVGLPCIAWLALHRHRNGARIHRWGMRRRIPDYMVDAICGMSQEALENVPAG